MKLKMTKKENVDISVSISGESYSLDESVKRLYWFMSEWIRTERNNHKNNIGFEIKGISTRE